MKLYCVEAPIKSAEVPYWARAWVTSGAEASKTRSRYTGELEVARKDIRTTEVEVDTRKDGLVVLLNQISNTRDGYLYPEAK